jgi:hypothetical protein
MGPKLIILVDFDGVIHSYTSGWQGADVVADPPVRGAIAWLKELVDSGKYDVQIYSSRSSQEGGIKAMQAALRVWSWRGDDRVQAKMEPDEALDFVSSMKFPTVKPPAWLTIDDRAKCFTGTFPNQEEIDQFKPWYKV